MNPGSGAPKSTVPRSGSNALGGVWERQRESGGESLLLERFPELDLPVVQRLDDFGNGHVGRAALLDLLLEIPARNTSIFRSASS